LHDGSVSSLDNLLDPVRGDNAPHPFYLADASQRADMVEFLRGLDTTLPSTRNQAAVGLPVYRRQHSGFLLWGGWLVVAAGMIYIKLKQGASR
jgi:hypothetical protein